jgi:hypothetical protein
LKFASLHLLHYFLKFLFNAQLAEITLDALSLAWLPFTFSLLSFHNKFLIIADCGFISHAYSISLTQVRRTVVAAYLSLIFHVSSRRWAFIQRTDGICFKVFTAVTPCCRIALYTGS